MMSIIMYITVGLGKGQNRNVLELGLFLTGFTGRAGWVLGDFWGAKRLLQDHIAAFGT